MSVFYIRNVQQTAEQINNLTKYELFDINIHCMRKSFLELPIKYAYTKTANGVIYTYTVRCLNSAGSYLSAYNTTGKSITYVLRPTISSLTSPQTQQMLVKWGKNAKATGYQIQYSTSSTFSSGNKTVSGKNYYSVWSAAKNVTIK